MLRDVALRSTDGIDDFLHAGFLIAEHAQNLQPQLMRNGFQGPRGHFNMFLFVDQVDVWFFQNYKTSFR